MSDAPGMDAVLEAFAREYGAAPRLDFRTPLPPEVDPHPAKLVTAWAGPGYWHLVTCGLTELFKKFSNIPDQSGWGMELTMKVPRAEGDESPPEYAVELLRFLVKYVYSNRKSFGRGQLSAGSTRLLFRPEPRSGWSQVEGLLTVDLTPEALEELRAALGAAEANAPILVSELSGLTFRCMER